MIGIRVFLGLYLFEEKDLTVQLTRIKVKEFFVM